MKKKLLRALRDHLVRVPEPSFDMAFWECGTVRCAAGHGCDVPELAAQGLHLVGANLNRTIALRRPDQKDLHGIAALEELFDISHETALWLFDGAAYGDDRSLEAVVNRLDFAIHSSAEEEFLYGDDA